MDSSLVCCSCGVQATRQCSETFGLVCGADLCADCEHVLFPDGTNGGFQELPPELKGRHVKKVEQIYTPWYARD